MDILKSLKINSKNAGASYGNDWWSETTDQGTIESINPANEKLIASVYECSHQDYEKIVTQSQQAWLSWREYPAPKRGEIVRQIGEALRKNKSLLGSLVSLEMGKSKKEGDGEVQEMIDMADFAVGQSRMLYGLSMHSERYRHRMYEQWQPLGITGVITSFNFPVAVWSWNTFIAAICGNTIIWRPSHKTPLCAIAVQQICNDVMKKNDLEGIFSLFISHNIDLARTFVEDKRIPIISFTGSTKVGVEISQKVAKRMGRCLLECSGNNAIIVDETADLALAIRAIAFGAIGTAGQRCTSVRRLFVHESIDDKIISNLKTVYSKVTIGDPLDENNLMGPLIDQESIDKYNSAIQDIKDCGGEIIYGGKVLNQAGFYVEPTLVKAKNEWPIVQKETFAPILYIMTYKNIEDAIKMQNDVEQGLSSAIFSNHVKNIELFLSAAGSDCGIANVNIGTSGAEIGGAFGGEKATGGGREAGSDSWKEYMRRQTVTINWSDELPLAQGIKFDTDI